MYEWLEEIQQMIERVGGERTLELNSGGASDAEIARVEKFLKSSLPDSYKKFLRHWNGCTLTGSRVFSTAEIVEFAGTLAADVRENQYHAAKPAEFLVFRTFELGADVFCFDASQMKDGEYPVCRYDAENDSKKNLKPLFPSFEAMMMSEVLDIAGDGAVYEDFMDEADDDEIAEVEEFFSDWEQRLTEMLETRGADLSNRLFPDWSNWKSE